MGKFNITHVYEGYGRSLVEFQTVVLASLIVVGTALLLGRSSTLDLLPYSAGAALIVIVTVLTWFCYRSALFLRYSLLLPLIDIAGIRLTMLADQSTLPGGALLLVLPVIWIAYSFGPWGFAICLVLVAVTSPQSFISGYANFESSDFTRLILFPLTLLLLAIAAGVSGVRLRKKRSELAAQTALTAQAVKARDDLIEAVTHELRTPLTSILGNAELVLSNSDQPEMVERRAGVVVRNAEQMDAILADLLLARSTGTSQLGLRRTRADVRGLIENSVAASRAAADEREVGITQSVSGEIMATVDPNRIRQVLDNLLTNAVKYNRIGGTVTITEGRTADTVTLTVADTGLGIGEAELDRVFEPYYRTESARNSTQAGTGLGLGISREIARRHGGDLRIAESSGAGTRFELTLPLE